MAQLKIPIDAQRFSKGLSWKDYMAQMGDTMARTAGVLLEVGPDRRRAEILRQRQPGQVRHDAGGELVW